MKIFIDTSILIEYSRTGGGMLLEILKSNLSKEIDLVTSTIVIYEFWRGKSLNQEEALEKAKLIFSHLRVVQVTDEIAKKAGELDRNGVCDGFDAIIAATALEENALVATLNTKHFTSIPGLRLWRPSLR